MSDSITIDLRPSLPTRLWVEQEGRPVPQPARGLLAFYEQLPSHLLFDDPLLALAGSVTMTGVEANPEQPMRSGSMFGPMVEAGRLDGEVLYTDRFSSGPGTLSFTSHALMVVADRRIVGKVIFAGRRAWSLGTFDLYVEPEHRGSGLGGLLLRAALDRWPIDLGVQVYSPAGLATVKSVLTDLEAFPRTGTVGAMAERDEFEARPTPWPPKPDDVIAYARDNFQIATDARVALYESEKAS